MLATLDELVPLPAELKMYLLHLTAIGLVSYAAVALLIPWWAAACRPSSRAKTCASAARPREISPCRARHLALDAGANATH